MANKLFLVLWTLSLGSCLSALGSVRTSVPMIEVAGRKLTALPAKEHTPTEQNLEILEKDTCDAKVSARNTIEVSENCRYLHAVYRYIFVSQNESDKNRHQVLMDFSFSKAAGTAHTLLVNEPLEIDEKSLPGLPR